MIREWIEITKVAQTRYLILLVQILIKIVVSLFGRWWDTMCHRRKVCRGHRPWNGPNGRSGCRYRSSQRGRMAATTRILRLAARNLVVGTGPSPTARPSAQFVSGLMAVSPSPGPPCPMPTTKSGCQHGRYADSDSCAETRWCRRWCADGLPGRNGRSWCIQ